MNMLTPLAAFAIGEPKVTLTFGVHMLKSPTSSVSRRFGWCVGQAVTVRRWKPAGRFTGISTATGEHISLFNSLRLTMAAADGTTFVAEAFFRETITSTLVGGSSFSAAHEE